MLGINGWEFLVIVLVAILVVGPERMPAYAKQFRDWVVAARDLVTQNKDKIKAEMGDEVDWKQYDPRQYDPRRIVREALAEPSTPVAAAPAAATRHAAPQAVTPGAAPYDPDAT
ncbi:hypothetical protein [Demequina sp.]|uniref:hypothetical protein n=1 Tax=Demequina sp. TaxID=2050685 RepID=UPI003A8A1E39